MIVCWLHKDKPLTKEPINAIGNTSWFNRENEYIQAWLSSFQ